MHRHTVKRPGSVFECSELIPERSLTARINIHSLHTHTHACSHARAHTHSLTNTVHVLETDECGDFSSSARWVKGERESGRHDLLINPMVWEQSDSPSMCFKPFSLFVSPFTTPSDKSHSLLAFTLLFCDPLSW